MSSCVLYLKERKNQECQPVTWASVGTSFPLVFCFFPTRDGREQLVFSTTGRRALPSSAPTETWAATMQARAPRNRGGFCSPWDMSPGVIVRSSLCPVMWRQAEIAWDCLWAAVCFASEEKGGRGCAGYTWVVPPPTSLEYNGCTRQHSLTYCPGPLEKP